VYAIITTEPYATLQLTSRLFLYADEKKKKCTGNQVYLEIGTAGTASLSAAYFPPVGYPICRIVFILSWPGNAFCVLHFIFDT